jgi:signal transduction histidine kinase
MTVQEEQAADPHSDGPGVARDADEPAPAPTLPDLPFPVWDSASIGFAVLDGAVIRRANAALARIIGRDPVALAAGSLVDPDQATAFEGFVHAAGREWTSSLFLLGRPQVGFASQHLAWVCRRDDVVELIIEPEDITELRETLARVDHARRYETVARLAGGVAHNFNNVLTTIIGYAELLATSFDIEDPRRADALAIGDAGRRAATLAKQLLAYGRRLMLLPSSVDLMTVVEELSPMLHSIVGDRVQLVICHDSGRGRAWVDRTQLEDAVVNLVIAARDSIGGAGQITIERTEVTIGAGDSRLRRAAGPGLYQCLSVRDTGAAIPPEAIMRVFEPFFAAKELGRGTDLGLSSVHGFVAQSGGFMFAASERGRGSSISIFLPDHRPWAKRH